MNKYIRYLLIAITGAVMLIVLSQFGRLSHAELIIYLVILMLSFGGLIIDWVIHDSKQ